MAGTLFGLGLSQQFDGDGDPLSGCKLYIYEAGTTNPVDVFQDYNLSLAQTWPVIADANGRIPMFWLDNGSYRARLTDAAGVVQFDYDNIQALGPSSGTATGGTIDATTIFATGDVLWNGGSGVRTGWVRANGRTIGSATSGASERANADTEALYSYLWGGFSDAICPVTTGRGANAAADFAANKPIAVLDMRGRGIFGVDQMGAGSAASRLDSSVVTSGTTLTPGNTGGSDRVTLTSDQMPSHTHVASVTDPGHAHDVYYNSPNVWSSGTNAAAHAISGSSGNTGNEDSARATTGITVSNASTGGGAAHTNMPPFMLGTFYIKL